MEMPSIIFHRNNIRLPQKNTVWVTVCRTSTFTEELCSQNLTQYREADRGWRVWRWCPRTWWGSAAVHMYLYRVYISIPVLNSHKLRSWTVIRNWNNANNWDVNKRIKREQIVVIDRAGYPARHLTFCQIWYPARN